MFSVTIPVYNHSRYLLDGVLSALRSPLVSEVLLVDDGSSDDSAETIWHLCENNPDRVRGLSLDRASNLGAPRRLNQLINEASCDWIAILNSDDIFTPGRFEALYSSLKRSNFDFAWGHLIIIDENGRATGTKRGVLEPEYPFPERVDVNAKLAKNELTDLLANQNVIATTSNMVFTKRLHDLVGGFADYRYVHDWDFALRASAVGNTLFTPQFLTGYRIHGKNTISEENRDIRTEVQHLFQRFTADFPEVASSRSFRLGLNGNQYID